MNKQEREILEALFWFAQELKSEHWGIYRIKEVLQSVLKGEYGIARTMVRVYTKKVRE